MRINLCITFSLLVCTIGHAIEITRTANAVNNIHRTGSTSSWTGTDNTNVLDGAYASTVSNLPSLGNYSDYLQFTDFQFGLPGNSVITGVTVTMHRSNRASNSLNDETVRLLINGTPTGQNKAYTLTNAWSSGSFVAVNYGDSADLWNLSSLDPAQVNAANFGLILAVRRSVSNATPHQFPRLDRLTITIHFSMALPIQLIEFKGLPIGDYENKIEWSTASEINSDYFCLQRSNDGLSYEDVYHVKAAGYSQCMVSYSTTDEVATNSLNYYRLKQVDLDGAFSLFGPISLHNNLCKKNKAFIYPNPIQDKAFLTFDWKEDVLYQLDIANDKGQIVATLPWRPGESLSLNFLSIGTYHLIIHHSNQWLHRLLFVVD